MFFNGYIAISRLVNLLNHNFFFWDKHLWKSPCLDLDFPERNLELETLDMAENPFFQIFIGN